jgi:general secretion pathway protein B
MSILLEALKKSEQQRQLGQTPTLQTDVEDQPNSNVTLNHWFPLSLMALSAGVMVWFGWQQYREPEPGTVTVPVAVAQTDGEPQPRTMTETFQPEGAGQEESMPVPPVESMQNEDARARLNQSFNNFTAENEDQASAAPTTDLAAVDEPSSEPLTAAELLKVRLRQARADSRQPQDDPAVSGAEPRKSRVGRERSKSEPAESKLEPHVSEPISYWELPQGVRDDLPEIKITVLVYAEEPDDRFLLNNGQRMVEKDEVQGGLVLDEIRRDGAIFLYRKYRFLVKG